MDGEMTLKILLPSEVFFSLPVRKITADGVGGFFTLLPKHIDWVSALVPGILYFHDVEDREQLVAVDGGLLVKCGPEVLISTRQAVRGDHLATLQSTVVDRFQQLDEQEKQTRAAIAHLEASLVRRFLKMDN